jgi:hypothetical protein
MGIEIQINTKFDKIWISPFFFLDYIQPTIIVVMCIITIYFSTLCSEPWIPTFYMHI